MAAGVNLPFLADVKSVIRGTDDIADGIDKVADSVDDLGRDTKKSADKAGDALADGMGDGAKDAGTAVDKLEKKASDAFRAVAADSKTAGDKVGKSQSDGFKEASEGSDALKENAAANAKEVTASFDGSASSIADGFQGLAAEAFEGFGPAGLAAGVLLAAGIGLASAKFQEIADRNNQIKTDALDLMSAIDEAGGKLENIDLDTIISDWGRIAKEDNPWTFWANEATTNFQDTADKAKKAGVATRDAIRGMKGSADDSKGFLSGTQHEWEALNRTIEAHTTVGEHGEQILDDTGRAAKGQRDALKDLRDGAQDNIDTTKDAIDIYGLEQDALDHTAEKAQEAADAIRDKADASREAAGNAMDSVSAEIAYNDAMAQGAKDIKANGKGLDLHTAVGKANQQTLLDMAKASNDLRDAQIDAGTSTADITAKAQEARDAFIQAATNAGMNADAAGALADKYGLIPGNVDTYVKAHDVEKTKGEIDGVAAPRTATVDVQLGRDYVTEYITGMNGKKIVVDVQPRTGVGITN